MALESPSSDAPGVDQPVPGHTDTRVLLTDRLGWLSAARDDIDNSMLAIRRLRPGCLNHERVRAEMRRTVAVAARLRDRRLVPMCALIESGGGAIIEELVEAVPLSSLLDHVGTVGEEPAAFLLHGVLAALEVLTPEARSTAICCRSWFWLAPTARSGSPTLALPLLRAWLQPRHTLETRAAPAGGLAGPPAVRGSRPRRRRDSLPTRRPGGVAPRRRTGATPDVKPWRWLSSFHAAELPRAVLSSMSGETSEPLDLAYQRPR